MHRIAIIILAALVAAAPALAQGPCIPGAALNDQLRGKYGESPVMTGTGLTGVPFIMFANPETGTWSFVLISPEAACIVMTGRDFDPIARPPGSPT